VAEDHQTKNARALAEKDAALLIPDGQIKKLLISEAVKLVSDKQRKEMFSKNIARMAERDADLRIAEQVLKLTGR
jgi:UDP-N-acetylglucosamine--N-acetylmuramyl-(pentapeptide) pyrophosphoryl-undecaprenol N-acetylglucosamine transferase